MKARALLIAVVCALLPAIASPQALTSLSSLRVGYNTRKNSAQPQGELKAQIDALDKEIAEANRLGKTGELRRLFAKGNVLLAGRPWTDAADYANSLVIRTDRVVVDSSKPYAVRLEQIYSPAIQLRAAAERACRIAGCVRRAAAGAGAAAAAAAGRQGSRRRSTASVAISATRRSPFDLDLQGVADGTYQLAIDVSDETRALGTATLLVSVRKGLDDLVARLEADAKKAPAALRDDILYPVDRMRNVNRGRLDAAHLRSRPGFPGRPKRSPRRREPARIRSRARPATSSAISCSTRRRDHAVSDVRADDLQLVANVPAHRRAARPGRHRGFVLQRLQRRAAPLAEQHGYIVAAPLGFRVDGSYGWGLGNPPADPATRRVQDISEKDVMQVLQLVRQQYQHRRQPDLSDGSLDGRHRHVEDRAEVPGYLGGDRHRSPARARPPRSSASSTSPSSSSMATRMPRSASRARARWSRKPKELGIEDKYIEVPGGSHGGVVAPNLAAMFEFFNAHKKSAKATSQQ